MDKNIAEMNSWLNRRMNVFRPSSRDSEKLSVKLTKRNIKSALPQKPCSNEEKNRKKKDEIDHYKFRVHHLRDECNALYKDLITLRRDKSEFYESFAKENNDCIMQMIYEIHRAEEEIVLLEKEVETAGKENEKTQQKDRSREREINGKHEGPNQEREKELLRSQQDEAREALKTLRDIVTKLKEQLASFHNYVSAMHLDGRNEKHGDQANNGAEFKKKERMKKYDILLKELGIRSLN